MTYIVSSGALNSTHSLLFIRSYRIEFYFPYVSWAGLRKISKSSLGYKSIADMAGISGNWKSFHNKLIDSVTKTNRFCLTQD